MSEVIKNSGWWGKEPSGDDIKTFAGTIVWPKRNPKVPRPTIGDTIVDNRGGRLIGFEVKGVGDSRILSDENIYLDVVCDGYTYNEAKS